MGKERRHLTYPPNTIILPKKNWKAGKCSESVLVWDGFILPSHLNDNLCSKPFPLRALKILLHYFLVSNFADEEYDVNRVLVLMSCGLNSVPQNMSKSWLSVPVSVTLFVKRVSVDIIKRVEMRSFRLGPRSEVECPYNKGEQRWMLREGGSRRYSDAAASQERQGLPGATEPGDRHGSLLPPPSTLGTSGRNPHCQHLDFTLPVSKTVIIAFLLFSAAQFVVLRYTRPRKLIYL